MKINPNDPAFPVPLATSAADNIHHSYYPGTPLRLRIAVDLAPGYMRFIDPVDLHDMEREPEVLAQHRDAFAREMLAYADAFIRAHNATSEEAAKR